MNQKKKTSRASTEDSNKEAANKNDKTSEIQFKKKELRDKVLSAIAVTAILGGSLAFPTLPIILGSIISLIEEDKGIKIPPKKIKRVLENLEKKDIIYLETKGDQVYVHIKNKNNFELNKYSIKALLDFKQKKKQWKNKWIMIFFDVPENQRSKRDYLRRFLTQMGFFPYQKSVYVFPYECEEEINLIKKIVEGGSYIRYVIASYIDDEHLIKQYFKL